MASVPHRPSLAGGQGSTRTGDSLPAVLPCIWGCRGPLWEAGLSRRPSLSRGAEASRRADWCVWATPGGDRRCRPFRAADTRSVLPFAGPCPPPPVSAQAALCPASPGPPSCPVALMLTNGPRRSTRKLCGAAKGGEATEARAEEPRRLRSPRAARSPRASHCSFAGPRDRHSEAYTWTNPTCCVHNVIIGKLWIEQYGTVEILNHR